MSQIKPEQIAGLVRPETHKGDENSGKPYTAIMNDGRRVALDAGEAKSLMNHLDKNRSKMEREGTREKQREPETREKTRVASKEDMRRYLENFKRGRDG